MKHSVTFRFACALGLLLFLGAVISAPAADELAWPPITSQTRPWVWWWWHGSAVDRTNITRELQQFHDAGLGGVQITAIFGVKGAEARDIPYLTPEWLAMMGYSVDEAKRLGMGVTMTLGTGWCFGGPTVSDEDANASVVVKTYQLGVGERINEKLDRDSIQALVAFGPDGKSIDLTDSITTNGEVFFSPGGNWRGTTNSTPPKTWTVYAISQKPSEQKVKRPAPGGEGWMLNPAYPQAERNWLMWFDKPLAGYTGSKPQAVFEDSYEYHTDWSPDFFAQFEKLRGYKLQTELPTLFGTNTDDHSARVKYDYRRTMSDIMAGQSEPAWIGWAHKNGFSTIYQAHGSPGNWLDLYADADMPETEMFHIHNDSTVLISKFASSAAHTQGRPLTGAETGTWLKEHFTETLADVKSIADDMFLAGINRIFYHGACYSPDDAPWPGWVFYASTEMNPRNPIWRDVPAVNDYVARVQSILQSGKPDNDVLLYWPVADYWNTNDRTNLLPQLTVRYTDWFEKESIGRTAHELWNQGYAFDYVSDAQLLQAKVVDGKIRMPGGDYKTIVVLPCKYMPLETFKQLLSLAESGAKIVMNNPPQDVSGFSDLENRRAEFKKLLEELNKPAVSEHFSSMMPFGKGVIFGEMSGPIDAGAKPEEMTRYGLSFVRRSFDGGWNYFIANRSDKPFYYGSGGWLPLSVDAKSVEIMDPMTGKTGVAKIEHRSENSTWVLFPLAAGESVILRAYSDKTIKGPAWSYPRTIARNSTYPNMMDFVTGSSSGFTLFSEISGEWKIKFLEGGPVLPADFQTNKLVSWTAFPDTNCLAFAGTAKYETMFNAPNAAGKSFEINLGDVRQSARVKLNGKDYGTLIAPPFRVVVDNLKPTGNQLEVEVTSVAANRIRDLDRRGVQWKIFKDINFVNLDYQPFDASNWPLTDCGLLGPVTLTAVARQ